MAGGGSIGAEAVVYIAGDFHLQTRSLTATGVSQQGFLIRDSGANWTQFSNGTYPGTLQGRTYITYEKYTPLPVYQSWYLDLALTYYNGTLHISHDFSII